MNDLERLMNAAITTRWTVSPALFVAGASLWTLAWNRLRGAK